MLCLHSGIINGIFTWTGLCTKTVRLNGPVRAQTGFMRGQFHTAVVYISTRYMHTDWNDVCRKITFCDLIVKEHWICMT